MTSQQRPVSSQVAPRWTRLVLPAAGLLLFGLLTWPTWRWLWGEWMGNDYYSHGVLIGPVAVYLAWRRLAHRPVTMASVQFPYGGLTVLFVALGAYLYFDHDRAFYLAALAMIGLLVGFVWMMAGIRIVRLLAFPLAYLTFMVPLPFVERITYPLALFTGVCSAALVRFLGMDITVVGNAITLPNVDLVIGAQCSGINSMIALTSFNALVAYAVKGPLWGRIGLVVLAVPLAMLGNILRVANLLFVARKWGAEAAFRFYHDYSGLVFFGIVLLLLAPLARLLRCGGLRDEVL